MFKNFYIKAQSSTAKRLLANFFSLSGIQMASYILPIITVPYLVRVLGVEKFGLVIFAQVITQYFVIFSDYGFGLSATKEVAEHRKSQEKLSDIFSAVFVIKFIFVFLCFSLLSVLVYTFDEFRTEWKLYYLSFGVVIGQALFPVWYFQGLEKMHITALVNILPKIVFTLSIFIFINSPEDYLYVPLINSLGFIFAGLISIYIAFYKFNAHFALPSKEQIQHQLKEGWYIFLGIITSNMTTLNVTLLLGILTNPVMLGYYAAVEKIIRPLSLLNRPVINAIFPHLVSMAKTDPQKTVHFSKKVSYYVSIVMFILGLILFVFSDELVKFIFGKEFGASSVILKIMAFIPMLRSLIEIYAVPNMIIFNFKKSYSNILFLGLFVSFILSYMAIKCYATTGAAFAAILTDMFILVSMFIYLKKHLKIEGKNSL